MEVLAIIPARGGSKGLPGKNVRPLLGHPLIAWSILAAHRSPSVTRVVVSTDSEEIAAVARFYGAEVPFMRPDEFAQDMSTDLEVFGHALNYLAEKEGYTPDLVLQLRPTCPIRRVEDIEACILQLKANPEATSIRSLAEPPHTPYKMWKLPTHGSAFLEPLLTVEGIDEPYNEPRQRLPKAYWHTGNIDVIRPEVILSGSMTGKRIMPYLMDAKIAVDIDDLAAFVEAAHVITNTDCICFNPGDKAYGIPERKPIRLFLSDVDGVLTDAGMYYTESGDELKKFNTHDGMGFNMLQKSGIKIGMITTEITKIVERRAAKLKMDYLYQGHGFGGKLQAALEICQTEGISLEETAYLGDDINCIELLSAVGWAACPADAMKAVKAISSITHLEKAGGDGAVREFAELVLEANRKLADAKRTEIKN